MHVTSNEGAAGRYAVPPEKVPAACPKCLRSFTPQLVALVGKLLQNRMGDARVRFLLIAVYAPPDDAAP